MKLRYESGLLLNVRSAAAIHRCFPLVRKMRRAAWIALPLGFLSLFIGQPVAGVWLIGYALVFFVSAWVGAVVQGFARSWGLSRQSPIQEVSLSPKGIRFSGSPFTVSFGWEAVSDVILLRRFIVLLMGPWDGIAIPRHRLDDLQDESVVEQLRAREGWPALDDDGPGEQPWKDIPDEIRVSFQPTASIMASASKTISWRSWTGPFSVVVLGGAWLFVGLDPLIRAVQNPVGADLAGAIPPLVLAGLYISIVVGAPYLQAKRAMKSPTVRERDQDIGISSTGLRCRGPLHDVSMGWDGIRRTLETKHFFLFFLSRAAAIYIPRSALTEADEEDIRKVLTRNQT